MAACHSDSRSDEYWNYLRTYVQCTKVAQKHEHLLVNVMTEASNDLNKDIASTSFDSTSAPYGADEGSLDSASHGETSESTSDASASDGGEVVSDSSSSSDECTSEMGSVSDEVNFDDNTSLLDNGEATVSSSFCITTSKRW
jgi:hypothetical protein